jgi:hypothetical protein
MTMGWKLFQMLVCMYAIASVMTVTVGFMLDVNILDLRGVRLCIALALVFGCCIAVAVVMMEGLPKRQ